MKRLTAIFTLLTALAGSALADGISIAPFSIAAGTTQDVDIVMEDEAGVYVSAQFNLYLPEGIELAYDDATGSYAYTSEHATSAFVGVSKRTDSSGNDYYQFYLEDRMMYPLGAGTIFTVTLSATDMVATGEQTAYIRTISLVDEMGGGEDIAEQTYSVTTEIPVSVSSLGYASFSWPRTLDFTESGAQAFVVTRKGEGSVTLEEVQTVPAGTGIIVKADEGTYYPQTTDDEAAADDVSSNLLTGTASGSYTVDADNVFVLSNLSNGEAGFYVADPGVTVAKYKAYLKLADAGDAKDGGYAFDFTPTGLRTMDNGQWTMDNSAIYNLNGQRMDGTKSNVQKSELPRGIYIVNGKKVVLK